MKRPLPWLGESGGLPGGGVFETGLERAWSRVGAVSGPGNSMSQSRNEGAFLWAPKAGGGKWAVQEGTRAGWRCVLWLCLAWALGRPSCLRSCSPGMEDGRASWRRPSSALPGAPRQPVQASRQALAQSKARFVLGQPVALLCGLVLDGCCWVRRLIFQLRTQAGQWAGPGLGWGLPVL